MDRRGFLTLAGSCLAVPAAWGAGPLAPLNGLAAAINKSGRQRMLSQRTAKAWAMLVLGVLPERAKLILNQSIALFEQQLAELGTLLPSDELRGLHLQLEHEWGRFRPLLADIRSNGQAVWSGSDAVLGAAHKLTLAYERAYAKPAGRLVNVSGRQRMLSQRMAKAYLFRRLGVLPGPAGEMLEQAMSEFARAHEELKAPRPGAGQIQAGLALVEQQWYFFRNALTLRDSGNQDKAAADVATTSERILEEMELIVGLYERAAREGEA